MEVETAVCRGCGMKLIGKPYRFGGCAYHPKTKEQCPVNQYGGYACSYECDKRASMELEGTMPGSNVKNHLSCFAKASLSRNWPAF